ncbi:hypothetical protein [Nocardia carnea]|uniref:hypothetical protein n=1 Tax=Nocardia carnea TaxID=37328 RepID=UPI002458E842|nr:hypothetical protein [Nocardia carnea]
MTAAEFPRLGAVLPALVTEIVDLLGVENGRLAGTVLGLRFHGRCTFGPACTVLLTAPSGSSGSRVVQVERDGEPVVQLSLDPTGEVVTEIERLDGHDIDSGLPPV